jgi:hypothetical protein
MSLIPITRDELKQLKIQADEEKRKADIAKSIKWLYDMIVRCATASTNTNIQFKVYKDRDEEQLQHHKFHHHQLQQFAGLHITDELIGDVVSGLRELFPDSKIEYNVAIMARAPDGKMYDVSKTLFPDSKIEYNLAIMARAPDGKMYNVITALQTQKCKVLNVDWS